MTYLEFQSKISKRWWWILVITTILNVVFLPWIFKTTFEESSTFKFSLKKDFYNIEYLQKNLPDKVILSENNLSDSYNINSSVISKYLTELTQSSVFDSKIKKIQELPAETKPDYEVLVIGGTILNIKSEFNSQKEADNFHEALKTALDAEIKDWNNSRPEILQLNIDSGNQTVKPKNKPIQSQLLPSLTGIILGLAISLIVPSLKKNK